MSAAIAHSSFGEAKLRRRAAAVPRPTAGRGTGTAAPAERAGDVADPDLPLAGEVVGAGRALAADRRRHRPGDVVVVDELDRDAGVGQHRARSGSRSSPRRSSGSGSPSRTASTVCSISIVARGPATMQGRKT